MAQEMSIKRVLLSDVAKLAGLSKATLSRYMNNSIVPTAGTPSIASKPPFANWTIAAIAWHAVLAKAAAKRSAWCSPILPTLLCRTGRCRRRRPLRQRLQPGAVYHPQQPEKVPVYPLAGYLPGRRPAVHHQPPDNGLLRKESSVTNALSCWMKIFPAVRCRKCLPITSRAGGSPPKS